MIANPQSIIKKIAVVLLILVAVVFLARLSLRTLVTGYIESDLIPKTAKYYGIDHATVNILKLGLFEAAAGPVRLGDDDATFLEIALISLRYTPLGLINRHIEKVIVNGVTINAARRDGVIMLPGFSPKQHPSAPATAEAEKRNAADMSWPVSIGAVVIDNAMINLALADDFFQLPLALALTPAGGNMNIIDGTLRLRPRNQEITINARLDLAGGSLRTWLEAPSIRLDSFADRTARFPGLGLSGQIAVSARADMAIDPFQVLSATLDLNFSNGGIAYRNIVFTPVDENTPITIKAGGSEEKGWQVIGSEAALSSPVPLRVSGFDCSVAAAAAPGKRQGAFSVALDRSAEDPEAAFRLLAPVALSGDVTIEYSDNIWGVVVTGRKSAAGPTDCVVKSGDITFKAPVPEFTLSAEGVNALTRADGMFSIPRATVNVDAEEIVLLNGVLRGEVDISRTPDNGPAAAGSLRLSTGKISAVRQKTEIDRMEIDFPFQWPPQNRDPGKVVIGPLTWRNLNLGVLTGTLWQEGRDARIRGQYTVGLLPGLRSDLNGRVGVDSDDLVMDMAFHLQHQSDAGDIDLGRFLPEAAGTFVSANLDATVEAAMNNGRFIGRMVSRIDGGKIRMPEKKVMITGIKAALTVPDLFTVKSDPDQKMSFEKAVFGDIHAADGEVAFQIESPRTVFIEKSAFKWCRGSVYAEGMRITPDRDEYDLTLYCDRLNLADVLNQVGGIQAEGQGTVSGRIPVRYAGGDISIDNGFLYSAPGEGGVIHLRKTDILTAGLPKTSPQYSQVDLAREALKNYQYDWAKVRLNSEDQNLHVKLEFDGRPTQSLPFVYDKKKGVFVRDANARQLSEFKGLSLDVNFRIPLNELIGYKGMLNM